MKKTHIKTIIFFFFLLSLVHVTNKNAFARAFSLEADTGLGYDSNAFRSPDTSYFDPFSKTTLIPKVQSGWFVPYKLLGAHFIKPRKKTWLRKLKITRWSSKFVLSGRKYMDSALDNADSRRFSGKTGVLFLLKKAGKRKNTFYIGPVVKQKKVTYYDRDTGVEKRTNAGLPLGDRYSYHFYGLDIKLKIRTTPVKFAVNAKVREYDYKATAFDQFDHTYYQVGGEASYKIITKTKLTVGYAFTVRDYDAWVARDLNGKKTPTLNPMRKYTFGDMDISLRHKLTRRLDIALDYNRQTRKDKFVGYADYTRNRYQAQASYGDKKKRKLQASLGYWTRNYPNTFAFDKTIVNNLPSPKTDYEAFDFKASGEIPLYKAWVFWGEFESTRQEVTDPRYDFDRYQITAGVKIDL